MEDVNKMTGEEKVVQGMVVKDSKSIHVGVLQLEPIHSDRDANMRRADELLNLASTLDLLVLPECAFTGYLFLNEEQVRPLAEVAGQGPTFEWCVKVAQRFQCGVAVGYIRIDPESNELYNSQMVVSPQGQLVCNHDKHFLYAADKTWAQSGKGFTSFKCEWLGGIQIGLGICMDINPYDFEAPWQAFEFANFHKKEESKIILFSSAWCNRHPDDPAPGPVDRRQTQNYWANRLEPLLGSDTYFFVADRVGNEPAAFVREGAVGDVTFVGSSCGMHLKAPALMGSLDTSEEALLVMQVPRKTKSLSSSLSSSSSAG